MHAETINAAAPAFTATRPRVHVVAADGRDLDALCAVLGQFVEICTREDDADWVFPLQAGDVPGPDAGAALCGLCDLRDPPALVVFGARRTAGADSWLLPQFDDRDPIYTLAASAGFALCASVWRGDVWRRLRTSGAAETHPRLAAVQLKIGRAHV